LKIDVVLLTKNSVKPCLDLCLKSIRREIPVNRLIVVDGGSTDGTLELIKKYEDLNPIIVIDKYGNRATSRQIGISKVETEFFAFIDSDVILPSGWFKMAIKYFDDPTVGAVWGAAVPIEPKKMKYYMAMARFYNKSLLELSKEQGAVRGMLHDTIIRTSAVENIRIPPQLHVMEDHYIRMYVEKRYKWISTEYPFCFHYFKDSKGKTTREAYLDMYYGWKLHVYSKKWYAKHLMLFWAKLLYLLLFTADVSVVDAELRKELYFLKAIIDIIRGK